MAAANPRILLVEDDLRLAELAREYLENAGLSIQIEERGDRAVDRVREDPPDAVILDVMLPGLNGFEVCRRLRPEYEGPVLMLTARRAEGDELLGLEIGADDYLKKPVPPRLLLARVHAHLRRAEARGADSGVSIAIDELVVDVINRRVTLAGEELTLTTAEFDLLRFLAERAGRVVERRELLERVKGVSWGAFDRSVDLTVARLRKKLGDDARCPRWIKSVRGVGYQMARNP